MLNLPWPPPELSPNKSLHFTAKMAHKKRMRDVCKAICKEHDCAWLIPPEGNIHIKLTFYPPNKRGFDLDNMLARSKSLLDGVADAWNINDVRFRPITIDMGEPEKGGRVMLEIIDKRNLEK